MEAANDWSASVSTPGPPARTYECIQSFTKAFRVYGLGFRV